MIHEDIEPLEPGEWLRQLQKLVVRPVASGEAFAESLRLAFHLTRLSPRPLRHIIHCEASEKQFEAFLEAQAFESAALALMGDHLGYRVKRSAGGGPIEAVVWLPDEEHRGDAIEASSIFSAWVKCLASLGELASDEEEPANPLVRRIRRLEGRLTSSEH